MQKRQFHEWMLGGLVHVALVMTVSACGSDPTGSTRCTDSSECGSNAICFDGFCQGGTGVGDGSADAADGTLAAACPDIDAIMMGDPDADPAGTAQKLDEIKARVTTPDADLIDAVAAAYADIANNPTVAADEPAGQQMMTTLSDASRALGGACQSATSAPRPN